MLVVKAILGVISIGSAVWGHLESKKDFEGSFWTMVSCVVIFLVCFAAVAYITYEEKFLLIRGEVDPTLPGFVDAVVDKFVLHPSPAPRRIYLAANLRHIDGQYIYEIGLGGTSPAEERARRSGTFPVSRSSPVTEFFDQDGHMVEENVRTLFQNLVREALRDANVFGHGRSEIARKKNS